MGRQINFYMSKSVDEEFINMLVEKKFCFIVNNLSKNCISNSIDVFFSKEKLKNKSSYLYKKQYGDYIKKYTTYGDLYGVDQINSPVIEFSRTSVDYEKKIVHRGRLWVPTNLEDQNVDKVILMKDYNMLVRWIRKRVPYQEVLRRYYNNDDTVMHKNYVNDEIKELVVQGFYLQ